MAMYYGGVEVGSVVFSGEASNLQSFNLTEMGLPSIPLDGSFVNLAVDTTEIIDAAKSGEMQITAAAILGDTTASFVVTIHPINVDGGGYVATEIIDSGGVIYTIMISIMSGQIVASGNSLNELFGGTEIPAVNASNNGMILQVVEGSWAAVSVAESSVKTYVDEYINEALGGDY